MTDAAPQPWKRLSHQFLEPGAAIEESLIPALDLAVRELLKEADWDDALDIYNEDQASEHGPAPYTSMAEYDAQWLIHPLTLIALDSEDLELSVVQIADEAGDILTSIYAGIYGYVVKNGAIFALNEQGHFSLMADHPAQKAVESALRHLVFEASDGDTLELTAT